MSAGLRTFQKMWLTNCVSVAIYRRAMCHPPFKIPFSGTKATLGGN